MQKRGIDSKLFQSSGSPRPMLLQSRNLITQMRSDTFRLMEFSMAQRMLLGGAVSFFILAIGVSPPKAGPRPKQQADIPRAHDPQLVVELFAAAPDIVHPINIDFDRQGRLLVIESHTHFRPQNYKG